MSILLELSNIIEQTYIAEHRWSKKLLPSDGTTVTSVPKIGVDNDGNTTATEYQESHRGITYNPAIQSYVVTYILPEQYRAEHDGKGKLYKSFKIVGGDKHAAYEKAQAYQLELMTKYPRVDTKHHNSSMTTHKTELHDVPDIENLSSHNHDLTYIKRNKSDNGWKVYYNSNGVTISGTFNDSEYQGSDTKSLKAAKTFRDTELKAHNIKRKSTYSGILGVTYDPDTKSWRTSYTVKGKPTQFKVFPISVYGGYIKAWEAACEKNHQINGRPIPTTQPIPQEELERMFKEGKLKKETESGAK